MPVSPSDIRGGIPLRIARNFVGSRVLIFLKVFQTSSPSKCFARSLILLSSAIAPLILVTCCLIALGAEGAGLAPGGETLGVVAVELKATKRVAAIATECVKYMTIKRFNESV